MRYYEKAQADLNALVGKDAAILAIETSCDETAAAIVKNGREVLGSSIYSQIPVHREYGGVVPELASRNHVEKLPYVVDEALAQAGMTLEDVDAFAVTQGPGLVGALLTGVAYAKSLAFALSKPLIPVNHMDGHISAGYITHPELKPPFLCLVASGGHTQIVRAADYGEYELLGETRDDAAGEAFDKAARVLGLSYPGGPNISRIAKDGDGDAFELPRSFKGETHYDFSFSGIKTAVINLVHNLEQKGGDVPKADVAASFQKAVVSVLVDNAFRAAKDTGESILALAGGVCANAALREAVLERAQDTGVKVYLPDLKYCTDNAAMIGAAAYWAMKRGAAALDLNANPALEF